VVVRNVRIKLDAADGADSAFQRTFEQFREAAQFVADYGWSDDPHRIRTDGLHDATYGPLRDRTDLHSNHVQAARRLAADALESCQARALDGQTTSRPQFRGSVVVYDQRTVTYRDGGCTLATVDGRVTAEFVLPEGESGTPFEEYWTDDWERTEATLHRRDGTYYLHVAVRRDVDPVSTIGNGAVLGVDLNVDGHLAVTSTGAFLGSADFLDHRRRAYERRRGDLQRTGTRSAHLTIQSVGGRFDRWSSDYLHQVSKAIVREARRHCCDAIAFEDLAGIRDRISNASKFQQWAFRTLREYKAEECGIQVDTVSPAYTSQRCSHTACGFVDENNRDGDAFECRECGKQLHADYNAARNIGWRYVQQRHTSGAGRADGQVALKSGTVSANGEFSPTTVDGGQSGSPPTSPAL